MKPNINSVEGRDDIKQTIFVFNNNNTSIFCNNNMYNNTCMILNFLNFACRTKYSYR